MTLISQLEELFQVQADSATAAGQEKYLKNKFKFFGIKKPVRAQLAKQIMREFKIATEKELIDIIRALWQREEREFHYTAIELSNRYKKFWSTEILELFIMQITTRSWWDSVDTLATHNMGAYMQKFPEFLHYPDSWVASDNLWLRRTALLYQLKYKEKTDKVRLFNYCEQLMHEKEFFIRKAIGWVLREYSKTNKAAVKDFLQLHNTNLSGLSLREASKYI